MFASLAPKKLPLSIFEKKITPINGLVEEGVIKKIFEVLPVKNKFCVEFGAGDGTNYSFTKNLIESSKWGAFLIEGDSALGDRLTSKYKENSSVTALKEFITVANIERLFKESNVPQEPAFMVIDVDGNDYYIWDAIKYYSPLVVCIEYNASFGADVDFIIKYDPSFCWSGDDYFGASFSSMVKLSNKKGYKLIHCTSGGDNLFFVRKDYVHYFESLEVADAFYQIPQYGKFGRATNGKGHPASIRNTNCFQRLFYRIRYYLLKAPRLIALRKV